MNLKTIKRKFITFGSEFDLKNWKEFEYGYYEVERKFTDSPNNKILMFYGFDPSLKSDIPFLMMLPINEDYLEIENQIQDIPIERSFTVDEIILAISKGQEIKIALEQLTKSK